MSPTATDRLLLEELVSRPSNETKPKVAIAPVRLQTEDDDLTPVINKSLPELLEALERQLISQAYEQAKHVKTETARLLGIKTSALYYKLEKYGFIKKGESGDL
jgi:DNA-binding NtrC family response regulator